MSALASTTKNSQSPAGIDDQQQLRVMERTKELLLIADREFRQKFSLPTVKYDLRGKAAGQYKVVAGLKIIRYNPHIFARYFEDNLEHTVAHEVAHHVVHERHYSSFILSKAAIKPHGKEWQAVMRLFEVTPSRTCNYDLSGLPGRRYKYFNYTCACSTHQLSSRRHNRIKRQQARYFCRQCSSPLVLED